MRLEGTCHCGNIAIVLETEQDPRDLPLRACACSFCRRHGARTTSDPAGRARVGIQDRALTSRYVFGLRTAEMVVCARCGVYCGAVMREGKQAWAVLNANLFIDRHSTAPPRASPTKARRRSSASRAASACGLRWSYLNRESTDSTASMSASVWSAETWNRISCSPRGTTG